MDYRMDKSDWGDGAWHAEPDFVTFSHVATHFRCEVIRMALTGCLNGYVEIASWHPWYGFDSYDALPVRVHGGLTYARMKDDVLVIGFDTAHANDLTPAMNARIAKYMSDMPFDYRQYDTYRDLAYVINEVLDLADQALGQIAEHVDDTQGA